MFIQTFNQFKIRRKHKYVVFKIDLEVSVCPNFELVRLHTVIFFFPIKHVGYEY